MGVTHVLKPLTEYFHQVEKDKIIINDLAGETVDDSEILDLVMTTYESDFISTVPKCGCPDSIALKGRARIGMLCSNCGETVQEVFDKIDANVWLRGIHHSEFGGIVPFISPSFWTRLSKLMLSSNRLKVDYLVWLCDPKYKVPPEALDKSIHTAMEEVLLKAMDGKRGYVNFIRNIDKVFEAMINHKEFTRKKRGEDTSAYHLSLLYEIYKHDMATNNGAGIFTQYIPIFNRSVFVMEKNPKGRFCSLLAANNISVIRSWINLCRKVKEKDQEGDGELPLEEIGRETAKVIYTLAELYQKYSAEFLYQKSGHFRKHLFGARIGFSFRGVIFSRHGPHDRHGVEIPWSVAVTLLSTHLKNKMHRDGLSAREINDLMNSSVYHYSEYVHQLILELEKETPTGKFEVLMQRNPSLTRSSILKLRVEKVLTDPSIKSIAVSQLIIKYCNGDYDGDNTNFLLLIDKDLAEAMEPFNTKNAIPDPISPFAISSYLTLLSTGNIVVFEILQDRREQPELDEVSHLFAREEFIA